MYIKPGEGKQLKLVCTRPKMKTIPKCTIGPNLATMLWYLPSGAWREKDKGIWRVKQANEKKIQSSPASATRMRRKMATAQSQSLRVITKTGTSGSFSRVRCSCKRSEDMLRKLATETTSNEAAVSRLIVAWFWVAWYTNVKLWSKC